MRIILIRSILVLMLSFITACSVTPNIQRKVESAIREISEKEIQSVSEYNIDVGSYESQKLTMAEAFYLAISRNPKITSLQNSIEESLIDIKQARSDIWPRIDTDLYAEFPDFEFNASKNLGLGIIFKYDVTKALFYKDLVSVQDVKSQQIYEQKKSELKRIYYRLFYLLSEIDSRTQQVAYQEKALQLSNTILDMIRLKGYRDSNAFQIIRDWERRVLSVESNLEESKQRLTTNKEILKRMLGLTQCSDIIVTDFQKYIPQNEAEVQSLSEVWKSLGKIWSQRNDIRVVEMDLYLAEMNIQAAKRKRFPQIKTDLGIGNIILLSEDDTASIVPSITLSIPLLDMGNIKREIQKAKIKRDNTKENLVYTARKVIEEIQEAMLQMKISHGKYMTAKKNLTREEQWLQTVEKMYKVNRIKLRNLYDAQLNAVDAKILLQQALFNYRKAAKKLNEAKGMGPEQELINF